MGVPEVILEDDYDDDMGECSIEHEESTCSTSSPAWRRSLLGRSPQERSCWSPQSMPSLEASDAASLSPSSTLSLSPLSSPLSRSLLDGEYDDDECVEWSKRQQDIALRGQHSSSPILSSPRCISSSFNAMEAPIPHPAHPSCGPPSWMCVFDLDDGPPAAGDIDYTNSSGCHDVYSEGLLPLVFKLFAGCEVGAGSEPNSSSLRLSPPQLSTSQSLDSPLRVPPSRVYTRKPGYADRVVRASTFLYAPTDQSVETLFVPVCSRSCFCGTRPRAAKSIPRSSSHSLFLSISLSSFLSSNNRRLHRRTMTKDGVVDDPRIRKVRCPFRQAWRHPLRTRSSPPAATISRLRSPFEEDKWPPTWSKSRSKPPGRTVRRSRICHPFEILLPRSVKSCSL